MQVSLRKYEFQIDKISHDKYLEFFLGILDEIKTVKMPNILAVYIYSVFYNDFSAYVTQDKEKILETLKYLLDYNVGEAIMIALNSMDNFLMLIITNNVVDMETYIKLTKKMEETVSMFTIKYYLMRHYLYNAYKHKLENNLTEMNKYLIKHISSILIMLGENYYEGAITLLKDTFNIEPIEFFKKNFILLIS